MRPITAGTLRMPGRAAPLDQGLGRAEREERACQLSRTNPRKEEQGP